MPKDGPGGGDGSARRSPGIDPSSGLESDAIRAQLDRILSSPELHATDTMRDFLRFIVSEKLAGRSDRIKGYTVAVRVFGRGEDFDPTYDPVVRIQAGRLRRALERYYLVAGVRDPILIDVPKGAYVPRFTLQAKLPTAVSGKPAGAEELPVIEGPRVAVLPFENLTRDPEQHILTVGLTEELITELTRFQDIVVVPCQPERRPPGAPAGPFEVARAVGARFLLQGAVRRDDATVKVSARLTDATDGGQVWADAYSLPAAASDLISTQERIAHDVVGSVASEYGIIARRLSNESRKKRPVELATYEAMLRYYSHQIVPSPESAVACFAALESAAGREPDYGPVWSALATLYCQAHAFDVPGVESALDIGLEYAHKGVSLDPGSQLAHLILAYASHLADLDETFREESQAALELNPHSPYAVGTVGYFLALRGELDRALPLLDRAIAMSPFHPAWFHEAYVIDLLLRRDYEAALAITRKHLPFITYWDDVVQAAILGMLGRGDEARPHVDRVIEQKPDFAGRARELFHRALKIESLLDELTDGLVAAGMQI